MPNSLSPAFVRINYTSGFGLHTMTLPSVPVILPATLPNPPSFQLRGLALPTPADEAVEAFVQVIKGHFPNTVNFIDYLIFQQADPNNPATPVWSASLGVAGSAGSPGWHKAVQSTITWRTEDFGIFKLVFLDCASFGGFDKNTAYLGGTVLAGIDGYVSSPTSWLSGRDGARPVTFLQQAFTLNEKLRRSYGMN